MDLVWTWLDEPAVPEYKCLKEGVKADPFYVAGKGAQWVSPPVMGVYPEIPCPAALLMEDGTITVYGDWEDLTSDGGCGCCAGSRDEKIVAWAPLNIPVPVR